MLNISLLIPESENLMMKYNFITMIIIVIVLKVASWNIWTKICMASIDNFTQEIAIS